VKLNNKNKFFLNIH